MPPPKQTRNQNKLAYLCRLLAKCYSTQGRASLDRSFSISPLRKRHQTSITKITTHHSFYFGSDLGHKLKSIFVVRLVRRAIALSPRLISVTARSIATRSLTRKDGRGVSSHH